MDPKSRHKGKLETEALLEKSGVNYTSVRPVRPFNAPPPPHIGISYRRLLTCLSSPGIHLRPAELQPG